MAMQLVYPKASSFSTIKVFHAKTPTNADAYDSNVLLSSKGMEVSEFKVCSIAAENFRAVVRRIWLLKSFSFGY